MKILVLLQSYPSEKNPYAQMWAHSRNSEYVRKGHKVHVLSFSANQNYSLDGVDVYSELNFDLSGKYDVIVSHQPNIRSHIRFLLRNFLKSPIVFFIHGHEVMIDSLDYSEPYSYIKKNYLLSSARYLYDLMKLRILRWWFLKNKKRISFVFVSEWMLKKFEQRIHVRVEEQFPYAIIPNPVNRIFIENSYSWSNDNKRDFLTIRQLDWSKHCVDRVVALAHANPERTFTLYGNGTYFNHHEKPKNLDWISGFLQPNQMPDVFDKHRCGLMPSRVDSQGVMMCEMATYGMPVLTSDIDVCVEMLNGFSNSLCLPLENFSKKIDINNWITFDAKPDKSKFNISTLVNKELVFFALAIDSFMSGRE